MVWKPAVNVLWGYQGKTFPRTLTEAQLPCETRQRSNQNGNLLALKAFLEENIAPQNRSAWFAGALTWWHSPAPSSFLPLQGSMAPHAASSMHLLSPHRLHLALWGSARLWWFLFLMLCWISVSWYRFRVTSFWLVTEDQRFDFYLSSFPVNSTIWPPSIGISNCCFKVLFLN